MNEVVVAHDEDNKGLAAKSQWLRAFLANMAATGQRPIFATIATSVADLEGKISSGRPPPSPPLIF